jgi:hypothetical protein
MTTGRRVCHLTPTTTTANFLSRLQSNCYLISNKLDKVTCLTKAVFSTVEIFELLIIKVIFVPKSCVVIELCTTKICVGIIGVTDHLLKIIGKLCEKYRIQRR